MASFAVLAAECWSVYLLYFFFFLLFEWLLLWSLSFCKSLLFHTLMFPFPPAFPLCYTPVSAMHPGNQDMESDAEDEVNHTLPTVASPALIILALSALASQVCLVDCRYCTKIRYSDKQPLKSSSD